MILISHRGNLDGPVPEKENTPEYIRSALDQGYQVEIDVWFIDGSWYLGHDGPTTGVPEQFLLLRGLWCHCKNLDALIHLKQLQVHCLFHQEDEYTLTSQGIIWGHFKAVPPAGGIHVMPELSKRDFSACLGVCSDFVEKIKADLFK